MLPFTLSLTDILQNIGGGGGGGSTNLCYQHISSPCLPEITLLELIVQTLVNPMFYNKHRCREVSPGASRRFHENIDPQPQTYVSRYVQDSTHLLIGNRRAAITLKVWDNSLCISVLLVHLFQN